LNVQRLCGLPAVACEGFRSSVLSVGPSRRAEIVLGIGISRPDAKRLAWILATSPDDWLRNDARAVQLAEDVASRAGHANAIVLRTLAAAYAETGRFNDAIQTAQQGIEIAKATGNEGLISDLERSVAAFRINQPIRSGPQY